MHADKKRDYEVGYGKPPQRIQFKPGQSGNPRGRPRDAKNLSTLVHEALNEQVIVTENGHRGKISKRRAIVTQLVNRSAQADLKATQILLAIVQDIERRREMEPNETIFDAADEKILEQLKARLRDEE
jgi:Family of unknown function (DUF5681)